MPRALIVLTTLFAALSVAVACGGTGDSSPNAEGTASASIEGTPVDGTPGVTRITPPESAGEYLNQYAEEEIIEERCTFDSKDARVDCRNIPYNVDPPPQDDDAECLILLVNDEPIAVRCASQEPLSVIYYAIAP